MIGSKKTAQAAAFSEASLEFLKTAGKQRNPEWLEQNDAKYQLLIRLPLLTLADSLKKELAVEADEYHFPTKGIGRIKKPAHKVGLDGAQFKDWDFLHCDPSCQESLRKNPLLFFGLLPNDPQWGGVVVAGGLYMATSLQTRRVRQAIVDDSEPLKKLFADKAFKKCFNSGFDPMAKATNCPRGFDVNHPDIEWIKLKTFFVCKTLTMKEFSSPELAEEIIQDFRQLLRLNEILQKAVDG